MQVKASEDAAKACLCLNHGIQQGKMSPIYQHLSLYGDRNERLPIRECEV